MTKDHETLAIKRVMEAAQAAAIHLPDQEAELRAIRTACTALLKLDEEARQRVLGYVRARVGL
jgi:hypothetical protein